MVCEAQHRVELAKNDDVFHEAGQGCWKEKINEWVQNCTPLTNLFYIVASDLFTFPPHSALEPDASSPFSL